MLGGDVGAVSTVEQRRFGDWRREVRAFLELFALNGVAVVQPTLDAVRRNANDVLVPVGATRIQILLLVATILLAVPLALWAVEVVVGVVVPEARRFAHAALAGLLFAVVVLEVLHRQLNLSDTLITVITIAFGIAGALLRLRVDVVGLFLRYLAVAPVIFTALFIVSPQVSPLVLTTGTPQAADVTVRKPSRVVMIVLDELPLQSLMDGTGHVDAGLYPNLAKLAAGSTWYRNTTSVAPYTQVAVPAILTGDYPTKPRAPSVAAVYPHNLFTLLGKTYTINAHENVERLDPTGPVQQPATVRSLLHQTYDLWREFATDTTPSTSITSTTTNREGVAIRKFNRSLGNASTQQLDYLHVLLPHYPWHLLPDGRSYADDSQIAGLVGGWGGGPELAAVGRQRHILQLQAADRLVGETFAKLRANGTYDTSLIVLTADHGEGFTSKNPIREATPANYSQIMWVPLFVKAPGQTVGRIDDRMSRSIDVLPTIADELGVKIPWKIDGHSLLGAPKPNGGRRFMEITSPDASKPPSEAKYKTWDGIKGFSQVLASEAAEPGASQDLRVYQGFSKFGDLVGKPAAPLVAPDASPLTGTIGIPQLWQNVDPKSTYAPWTYLFGRVDAPNQHEIAIAVNGTVASLTNSYRDIFFGNTAYAALLPPTLFRAGANDIQMYAVTGTRAAPHLEPIKRLN